MSGGIACYVLAIISPLVPHGEDVAIPSLVSPGVYSPHHFLFFLIQACFYEACLVAISHSYWFPRSQITHDPARF